MTEMQKVTRQLIEACGGAIPISHFMRVALTHPEHGYYTRQYSPAGHSANGRIFGSRGDFTTSPEISQLFGEVLLYILVHI